MSTKTSKLDELSDEMLPTEYDAVPDRTLNALRRYVRYGDRPGDFLLGVLMDSFQRAVSYADSSNREVLQTIGRLVWNHCPHACWGSNEAVEQWIEMGGRQGRSDGG